MRQSTSPRERQVVKQLRDQAAARVKEEAKRRATLLEPFDGVCWWCLRPGGPECPGKCELKERPDMSDFAQEPVPSVNAA